MLPTKTIVAPITPPGEGAVAIVRLSGPRSVEFLQTTFCARTPVDKMESHRLYHGDLKSPGGLKVDEVLAVVMRAPRSYTGEDVVEVHCHGGVQLLRSVLDLFLGAGAHMAAPGEFTQRAFVNGRMDLAQAEAVIEVIRARSERASRVALGQLDGFLSRTIHNFAEKLKESLALLEAHIDFPDDEVGSLDLTALLTSAGQLSAEMTGLVKSFEVGRILREGISLLILGRPNVGKSSLMNALLGESRAIVTEIPGTTRDTLEESLVLAGFPVRLIDSAGVRDTEDAVEREGVRRARDKALAADLLLLVLDGSSPLTEEDALALDLCDPQKTLLVINKCDKEQYCEAETLKVFDLKVSVSAKHGVGLEGLREAIIARLGNDTSFGDNEGVVITECRHRDALLTAIEALSRLQCSARAAAPLECLALDLRESLSALGQITGETTPDEILDHIFSRFCIGK